MRYYWYGYIQTFDADIKMFYSDPLYANTLVEAMEYLCLQNNFIPVVPHKAVAEVSKIGNL